MVYFATSVISVVTGATSLITVPVLLSFGVEPRTALATNMLALACLSAGAVEVFFKSGEIERPGLPWLLALTFAGSVAGALLVFEVRQNLIRIIVAVAMLTVGLAVLHPLPRDDIPRSRTPARVTAYVVTFILAIYGGFFSGGYVTILTAAWTALLHMPFKHAVATTKLANLVSSLAAVAIFAARGAIDWRLGVLVSAAAFLGAMLGARWTLALNELWLRRVFFIAVLMLALKTLVFDVQWNAVL
jgi:uncharacterized membrane protein YfcA